MSNWDDDEVYECHYCGAQFDDEDELNIHDCEDNPLNGEDE